MIRTSHLGRLSVVACICAVGLALASFPQSALGQLNELTTFPAAGSSGGSLSAPQGVATDDAGGDVYVVDGGNFRVEDFDATGNFILAFGGGVDLTTGGDVCTAASHDTCGPGTQGTGPGQFDGPMFVAADNSGGPSAGDVYIGDPADDVVSKFDASGELITSWGTGGQLNGTATFGSIDGIAVDGSGDLLVINSSNVVYEYGQNGTALTNFSTIRGMSPAGLAISSSGNLFKVNGDGSVEELSSAGTDISTVAGDGGDVAGATQIAVDPGTGDLYVDTGATVAEYEFDPSGNVLEPGGSPCTPAPGTGCNATAIFGSLTSGTGLAFDPGVTLASAGGRGRALCGRPGERRRHDLRAARASGSNRSGGL